MSAEQDIRNASPELIAKIEVIREKLESGDGKLEMDRLAEKGTEFRAACDFLEYWRGQSVEMGHHSPTFGFIPTGVRPERLVAGWLGIDLATVEMERAEFIRQYSEEGE